MTYVAGLTDEWKRIKIGLNELRPFPEMDFLCGWDEMSELVFTFEADGSGKKGTIYLDDIYVERCQEGAPTPRPECIPTATPSPSPTPTVTPTATPSPTLEPGATPAPTATPTTEPTATPQPKPLVIADFDSCAGATRLGGRMGAAYNPPDSLEET